MSQKQLEAVVKSLAEAEKAAGAKLAGEKSAARKRLDELQDHLGRTNKQHLEELKRRFTQEMMQSEDETARQVEALEHETDARIETMRSRHESAREQLVDWAVKRITGDA